MPLYTADALVLRSYKLGETSSIVVFLTRDRGKKRGVAKGARRPRSRFAGALEPLTEARVAYFESERRDLVGLNYAEVMRSPLILVTGALRGGDSPVAWCRDVPQGPGGGREAGPADAGTGLDGLAAGMDGPAVTADERATAGRADESLGYIGYFAELLDEWAQDADADERLYRLGASMVEALAAGVPAEPLARYFECWLLRLQGVYPETQGTLSAGAVAFLAASRRVPPQAVGALPADGRVIRELAGVHRAMIARHLEKTLKSERVIRDLRRHV